jgi:hypothetical protein
MSTRRFIESAREPIRWTLLLFALGGAVLGSLVFLGLLLNSASVQESIGRQSSANSDLGDQSAWRSSIEFEAGRYAGGFSNDTLMQRVQIDGTFCNTSYVVFRDPTGKAGLVFESLGSYPRSDTCVLFVLCGCILGFVAGFVAHRRLLGFEAPGDSEH